MYTTSLPGHIAKLRRIRAFLLHEAPLDDLGDLLSPFDAWVNCLETEIAASGKLMAFLQMSLMDKPQSQYPGDELEKSEEGLPAEIPITTDHLPPEPPQIAGTDNGHPETGMQHTNPHDPSKKPSESHPRDPLRSNEPHIKAIQDQRPQPPDQLLPLLRQVLLLKEFPAG